MGQLFAGLENGLGLVLLLDVHVERVEVQLDRLRSDRLDQLEAQNEGVKKIRLESGERLYEALRLDCLGQCGGIECMRDHARHSSIELRLCRGIGQGLQA